MNFSSYSNLPNKRTGVDFSEQNLDPCLVNIFDQRKWFQLIDLIPGFTSYRGPGIKLINWNHFHWSNIFTKHGSRFNYQNSAIVPVRLFGRSEYSKFFQDHVTNIYSIDQKFPFLLHQIEFTFFWGLMEHELGTLFWGRFSGRPEN